MEKEQEGRHKTEENKAPSSGSKSPEIVQVGVEKKGSDEASCSSPSPPQESQQMVFNDGQGGTYKIQAFIGDMLPLEQVYRAEFIKNEDDEDDHSSGQVVLVALKLSLPTYSFVPADGGYREGPAYDENDILFGITQEFYDKNLHCQVMPFFNLGSLRYIISRTPLKKLPEDCIAVILREVLRGLSNLHRSKRYHSQVNAGFIFVAETPKLSIKLCDQETKYFHNPEKYCPRKVWDEGWSSAAYPDRFPVSLDPTNKTWTYPPFFEPKLRTTNISAAADIFSLGVTAIEMAWGPVDPSYEQKNVRVSTPEEFLSIVELMQYTSYDIPTVSDLYLYGLLEHRNNRQPSSDFTSTTALENAADQTQGTVEEEQGRMKIVMEAVSEEFKNLRKKIKKFIGRGKAEGTHEETPDLADERNYQVSNSFIKFVKRCVVVEPVERPSAEKLLKDAFFKKYKKVPLQRFADVVLKNI